MSFVLNTEPCSLFPFIGPADLLGGLAIMVYLFIFFVFSLCGAIMLTSLFLAYKTLGS